MAGPIIPIAICMLRKAFRLHLSEPIKPGKRIKPEIDI
jgi:hypothetical protein